ncbi:MAG: thermosome subunit alpha [Halobacteriales archaeon]
MAESGQRGLGGQPLFILSEDSERTSGQDAQSANIQAGKAIAESVRTTLGPRGMDKMLVDDGGDVVITNDGATILGEMDIEHPAAQMIVEVAESQEEEIGDGTTTAAVLAGQLLAQAEELLDDDVHPTTIVEGYHEAARLAREAIEDQVIAEELDDDLLETVAESSMTGKGTGDVGAEVLAERVVASVRAAQDGDHVTRDEIHVVTRTGASSSATKLIEGVLLEEEPLHDGMPRTVEDADVAVLDLDLDVREADIDAEYSVSDVDQLNAALEAEERELRSYVDTLADAGVDVVFVTGDVEDRVAGFLSKEGILAFEDVDGDDAKAIGRATGARRVATISDLEADDLGTLERVSIQRYADDEIAFVEGGEAAEQVTLFVRGTTEHVANELERAVNDAVDVVVTALEGEGVVPGGGSSEIAIADRVRSEAAGIEGRKQLAVEAFADAVDVLPRTLAANGGMDPIDALVDLRSTFDGEGRAGVVAGSQTGHVGDPVEAGILDPAQVKREAVEGATEAAKMIVRIDDVISAE